MTLTDLKNIDELRQACADVVKTEQANKDYTPWGKDLREFLAEVQAADLQTRTSEEFQRKIWDDNPVTGVGMGQISVVAAVADPDFRSWIAEQSRKPLPDAPELRSAALDTLFDELEQRMGRYTDRVPRLKIYRVLAGFFPSDFTTVSHITKLRQLHSAMFGNRGGRGPTCHANILRRLHETIGPAGDDLDAVVDRMRLPWLLFTHYVASSGEERTESPEGMPGEESLVPLPSARRRKGLTGISGGRQALLNILEFCRDGAKREDLKIHIKTISPRLKDNSIHTQINVIASELNCLKSDGDRFVLTGRGHAFLESDDSGELMDWLITRILGVDHALVILRDEGPCTSQEMVRRIQQVNPGWTSTWAPHRIVKELRDFDMLDRDESDVLSLTDAGRQWAERIYWKPESLATEKLPNGPEGPEATSGDEHVALSLPSFSDIFHEVSNRGHFPEPLIRKLHSGIWANERRHFAVLTGLSGSGKTLLARAYGDAIAGKADGHAKQLCTIPVQPGWYDPSALLGYVNPLQGDSYVRTPFLEFLLAAATALERPFTVVLDEMNLSRPEQYLAPILSVMETGDALTLHREGEMFDGVPADVQYPSNLVIIGTVNMDETTHGISDKVLDRAFTIEFWDVDLAEYPRWGERRLNAEDKEKARTLLNDLMQSLRPARLHFGWRVVDDVLDYMERVTVDGGAVDLTVVLDDVVYAKVLPKLRGDDSRRFHEALDNCAQVLAEHDLKSCQNKVRELKDDLESTGSARFWR